MSAQRVLEEMLSLLWQRYQDRVSYAKKYVELVEAKGGSAINDHIALRTFKLGRETLGAQPDGIEGIARIFKALGYVTKDSYVFKDKHLFAHHYEHPTWEDAPKIFISELLVNELSETAQSILTRALDKARDPLEKEDLRQLSVLEKGGFLSERDEKKLARTLADFFRRPWGTPKQSDVVALNPESQYAAWTLLHGNGINHFTAYINKQGVKEWPEIEATIAGLKAAGVPMKAEIEGERGSKLRQSSTEAVMEPVTVLNDDGKETTLNWTYAYYELAERNPIPDASGKMVLFNGFLGAQATHLFEMTRKK